jgi:hypothetical protein
MISQPEAATKLEEHKKKRQGRPKKLPKWEYKTIHSTEESEELTLLNKAGEEHWDCYAILQGNRQTKRFYLKREK